MRKRRDALTLALATILLVLPPPRAPGQTPPKTIPKVTPIEAACPERLPVAIFDRRGSSDPARWVHVRAPGHVFADVRDVVLQSDLARVTYEWLNDEQQGSHTLYVKH